ncbi:MAG TPA: tripartite tricarboxylate transporter substrate-binding protein [Alphaproteobacteria bacterium]|nr:tripartite tricarboxylate transporter substrate-binding protein [Alphaproteobacteria bacterium]
MRVALVVAVALCCTAAAAEADDAVSFRDKTITMVIGYAPGGGTDSGGRLAARFLSKHLEGNPKVVVRNMPGADGATALNYMVRQTAPDGLTVTTGSSTQIDPINFRKPQVQYDPLTFRYIAGMGRKGTALLISADAEKRLLDPSASKVVMGSVGALPRSGMQITAWGIAFLGWNAKWVVGYAGTSQVTLALERGEIDMTSLQEPNAIQRLTENGKFRFLAQPGTYEGGKLVRMPGYGDAPLLSDLLQGRIADPTAQKAYDYWINVNAIDKWLALMPGTPDPIVAAYRKAMADTARDPEFDELRRKLSDDVIVVPYETIEDVIRRIAATPDDAIEYQKVLLRSQGLDVP